VLDFFTRFFKPERSGSLAKERLRLVLLSDHLSLAPDVVESLKRDLIEVISRYCEVDVANTDVSFEQQDSAVAMLANIPILGLRTGRPTPPSSAPPSTPPYEPPSGATPAHAAVAHDEPKIAADLATHAVAEIAAAAPVVAALEATVASPIESAKPKASRKRRRRRPNLTQQAPAT